MQVQKKIGITVALALGITMTLGICLAAAADAPPASIKGAKLTYGAGATGSAGFARGVQWAQVVNTDLGTQIAVEAVAGGPAALTLVQKKAEDLASVYMGILGEAYNAKGRYKERHTDVRALFPVGYHLIQYYSLPQNNIRNIMDINGKRVSLSRAGTGADSYSRRIFRAIGVKPSKIINVNPSESNDLLKNHQLDVCGLMGFIHPTIVEAASTMDVIIFGVDPKYIPAFHKELPTLQELTLPANTYRGQTKPLVTVGDPEIMCTNKITPADLVYWIVKSTYKNANKMGEFEPSFVAALKEPQRIKMSPVPLHKGAYRYYKEIGIDIPPSIIPKD
jgi:TRAP transporter TAXI family solute receptor